MPLKTALLDASTMYLKLPTFLLSTILVALAPNTSYAGCAETVTLSQSDIEKFDDTISGFMRAQEIRTNDLKKNALSPHEIVFHTEDKNKLRTMGMMYLTGKGVSVDYEAAVLVHNKVHDCRDQFPESPWIGQAAYLSANKYSKNTEDPFAMERAFSLHYVAHYYGIQKSSLAMGYLWRNPAIFGRPDLASSSAANAKSYFSRASECEYFKNHPIKWDQEICALAKREAKVEEQRKAAEDVPAWVYVAAGLVGLAMLSADQSTNDGVQYTQPDSFDPLATGIAVDLWLK